MARVLYRLSRVAQRILCGIEQHRHHLKFDPACAFEGIMDHIGYVHSLLPHDGDLSVRTQFISIPIPGRAWRKRCSSKHRNTRLASNSTSSTSTTIQSVLQLLIFPSLCVRKHASPCTEFWAFSANSIQRVTL